MGTRYEVTHYRRAHKEQVLRLLTPLWGGNAALNRSYFEWKYERNPYIRDPAICLALHRGEVVGTFGLVGARWRLGTAGPTQDLPFTDDLVVASAHRRRGLASSLIQAVGAYSAELGYPYLLCLRANAITTQISRSAGYRNIGALGPVDLKRDLRDPLSTVRQRLGGTRFLWRFAHSPQLLMPSDRWPFRILDRPAVGHGPRRASRVSIGRTPLPDAMAELVERLPRDDRIQHVRDREYFEWVFSNPRMEYRFVYWTRERLEGYLVLHQILPPRAGAQTWVSDWEGTSDDTRQELLQAAVSGRFARLMSWTATVAGSAEAMLSEHGFEETEHEARAQGQPASLIRPTRDEELHHEWALDGRQLMDMNNWKFRPLDQD
jgi:GNAT superfamily N-acetyltransferase